MHRGDPEARIERARRAVAVAFAINGFSFASWASRTPAIRDELGLSSGGLGLLLLCVAIGSLVALPLSGAVVGRIGPARTVGAGAVVVGVGLALAAAGLAAGTIAAAAPGLLLVGLGMSSWDVAMNVEGADVERRLGRTLMPRFHAAFSLGTVCGAGLGAACAALGISVSVQLLGTAVGGPAIAIAVIGSFVPTSGQLAADAPRVSVARAWRERRTLVIGVMVLCFALAEGIANDWLAVALVDGYERSDAVGAAAFGVFVAAMTLGRLFGGELLERRSRPVALRGLAAVVVAGVLLVVLGPSTPWAFAGAVLWGLGASLGFPVGMSAAADEEHGATARVSVVSSIGYTAFLAGPPVVGFLANRFGIRDALLVVPLAMAVAIAAVGASRPPASAPAEVPAVP